MSNPTQQSLAKSEGIHAQAENHIKRQCEAELYAAAWGASESKGIVSLLKDLGYELKPVLAIDAKATEHILHRQGVGKLKHIGMAYLWIQDEIKLKRLRVRRVRSEENVADLGTMPLGNAVIAKHCLTLEYVKLAEQSDKRKATVWDFGSIQMFVTGLRAVSTQNAAGDHVTESSHRDSSRSNSHSSTSSGDEQFHSLVQLSSQEVQAPVLCGRWYSPGGYGAGFQAGWPLRHLSVGVGREAKAQL